MRQATRGLRIRAGLIAVLCAACGGGGGGSSGSISSNDPPGELDPAVDFFLTSVSFGRPIFSIDGELDDVVSPDSLHETDPLTGVALAGFPKVLHEGVSLTAPASMDISQILDPLTPQIPLVPRNAALVLNFSKPVDATSLGLVSGFVGSSSTLQIRRRAGGLVPTRAVVDGDRVVLLGITDELPGFEASPLVFDQTGTPVQDPGGHLRIVLGSGVGVGTLASTEGLPLKSRIDRLGSVVRPFPFNPGNSELDAIVLQTDTGIVGFNGFLPDLTPPRLIRPVSLSGTIAFTGFTAGQLDVWDTTQPALPNVTANAGAGEWSGGRMEVLSAGGVFRYAIESNRNEAGSAVFRLAPGEGLASTISPGDTYAMVRTESFEPIPGPLPIDPVALASVTVDPESVPRDPGDPQDAFNSDLRYFVRMFDEAGVERTDRWNPMTSTFLAVPPRTTLRLQFSEPMDATSFRPYETFYVSGAEHAATDTAFADMRLGIATSVGDGTSLEFRPYLVDQQDPSASGFVGFGGTPQELRLVVRTLPDSATRAGLAASAPADVAERLADLENLGVTGCTDLGGRGLGLPTALFDVSDPDHFLLSADAAGRSPFPPAVDLSMTFQTLPSGDPDLRVLVHRFMGQAQTASTSYPPGTKSDTVTQGVEYGDHPPVDADGDGEPERRFIYGPTVREISLNQPGRLSGAPAEAIQHLIDEYNAPKPSPVSSPNGEDFLISLGFGASTPLNSAFGARFQHVYRAGDASPSKNDFAGVTLDLVGLAWSPFGNSVNDTVLDDMEILVGLSGGNRGKGPDTNQTNGIPVQNGLTGLNRQFDCNRLEFLDDCCGTALSNNFAKQLAANPQPRMTTVVKPGTSYTIRGSNLIKPANAGSSGFNLYLDYPTFNAGIDPMFGRNDVFSFPYDSRFPMLIEYSIGPNEAPPARNIYRFSPGVLTSVLPRFRIWSQGQDPAGWGVPNWTVGIGSGTPSTFLRAGEGGPLLKPGSYTTPVAPTTPHNGMPAQAPLEYILPPRTNLPGSCDSLQPPRDLVNGEADPSGCITLLPTPNTRPETNYYFANGMLVDPLPNPTAFPGATGQPPTFWYGYGVAPAAVGCAIPTNLGQNNQLSGPIEPGMTPPPSRFGDNSRYYMMWKYRKRVSIIESPTIRLDADRVRYLRPIVEPPLDSVDPAASLVVDFRASTEIDFSIPGLDSGYVRIDEPSFGEQLSGPNDTYGFVKFRASFGVAPTATQPPTLDTIVIPYERLRDG